MTTKLMTRTLGAMLMAVTLLFSAGAARAQSPMPSPPAVPAIPPLPSIPAVSSGEEKAKEEKKKEEKEKPVIEPEILAKLTPEQVHSILEEKESTRRWSNFFDLSVPLGFFLFLTTVIGLSQLLSYRKDQARHATMRMMLERGTRIPADLLRSKPKPNDRRRGILLVVGGTALAIFLAITGDTATSWTVGIIPMMLGGGYLLAWKLDSKDDGDSL